MAAEQHQTDWSWERIGLLQELWAEGLPTAEIGRRLQISKNSVIGKVHRLKLPARQSPIRTHEAGEIAATPAAKPAAAAAAAAVAAPKPLPPAPERLVTVSPPKPVILAVVPMTPLQPAPVPVAAPEPLPTEAAMDEIRPVSVPRPQPQRSCAWPVGNPGTTGFRYCGEDAVPTKPYCEQHCCRAYIRILRQDAATA